MDFRNCGKFDGLMPFDTVMDYNDVADATVDIGGYNAKMNWMSSGSGFHYINEENVITNYHVVKPIVGNGGKISVRSEDETRTVPAQLIDYSPLEENGGKDWAVLELEDTFSESRNVLTPNKRSLNRGDQVVFAGFPHGVGYGEVPDMLVQGARIAGDRGDVGFYIDGSVNKGNSGGPVVDLKTESVVGYVAFKRYVEHKTINDVMDGWENLHEQVKEADEIMTTGGLGYYDVLTEMTRSFLLLRETIETNANTGIGMGFAINNIEFP